MAKMTRHGTAEIESDLAVEIKAVAMMLDRLAWELAELEDVADDGDAIERRRWLRKLANDAIKRFAPSKLINVEAFKMRGRVIDDEHARLLAMGMSADGAKEQLRRKHGYDMSQQTAIRDVLTDIHRIDDGKAPRKARTRKLSQKPQ